MIDLFEESIGIVPPYAYEMHYRPFHQIFDVLRSPIERCKYGVGREYWYPYKLGLLFYMCMKERQEVPYDVLRFIVSLSFKVAICERLEYATIKYGWQFITFTDNTTCIVPGHIDVNGPVRSQSREWIYGFYTDIGTDELFFMDDLCLRDDWLASLRLEAVIMNNYNVYRRKIYTNLCLFFLYIFALFVDWLCYDLAISESITSILCIFFDPISLHSDRIRFILNPLRFGFGGIFLLLLLWSCYRRVQRM